MDSAQDRAIEAYRQRYGEQPTFLARAPGRVNLIGEHTDYNEGYVLPMAIDRSVWIAFSPKANSQIEITALDYGETAEIQLDAPDRAGPAWAAYPTGVAWSLQEAGYKLRAWRGTLSGDIPVGAGLSSSAAVELACARAFWAVSTFEWDHTTIARLCQRAENEWVGVECGIMDQLICAAAEPSHALLIDCRSLDTQAVPLPGQVTAAVLDTATRRNLSESAYNERRRECEAAASALGLASLRDLDLARLHERRQGLASALLRRARHVVSENARVLAAVEALRETDPLSVGRLLNASHASLRDDFEVSSPALDAASACAREEEGCFGARMTGAGFAGCAVALVESAGAPGLLNRALHCYRRETGLEGNFYTAQASGGAEAWKLA